MVVRQRIGKWPKPTLTPRLKQRRGDADGEREADQPPPFGRAPPRCRAVEIEDQRLVKIHWPNQGWLDDSHFDPPEIIDGEASFESDKGVEYTVRIIGEDGDCIYTNNAHEEGLSVESTDEVCSRCGNEKYNSKEYCNRCTDKEENTCSKCGGYEFAVYGGICSNCQEEENEEKPQEEY
ncbi:MAG: hypothetical protein EOP48_12330 [Sphingobacteriales bacterium]|nr:MAG: hypothetical protein EOP48_12330 [Sphingobacteriales bacterium]